MYLTWLRAVSVPAIAVLRDSSEPAAHPQGQQAEHKGRLGLPHQPYRFGLSELGPLLASAVDLTGQTHLSKAAP